MSIPFLSNTRTSLALLLLALSAVVRAQPETSEALARPTPVAPSTAPELDPNLVVDTIRANLTAMRHVYERHLRTRPDTTGRIVIEFFVASGLTVVDMAVVENTTGNLEFGKEAAAVLFHAAWPVAAVEGRVRFSYPFVFAPAED